MVAARNLTPDEWLQIRMAKATHSLASYRKSLGAKTPGHYDHGQTMGRAFDLAGSRSIELRFRLVEGNCECPMDFAAVGMFKGSLLSSCHSS